MTEARVFDPPAAFVEAGERFGHAGLPTRCAPRRRRDYEGFWASLARERRWLWHKPFSKVLDETQRAVLQVVRGRRAERFLQLPRSAPRERQRRQGRDHLRGRRRQGDPASPTASSIARVCRFANALQARSASRRATACVIYMPMSIEGVVAMQACARIGATHSVVFGGFSAKSLQERIVDAGAVAGDHRGRADARRQGASAQADRRRGARHGRLRRACATSSSTGAPAARSPLHARRDEWLHELWRRPGGQLRARLGRRRASAVHPLYLGLDRQAQGRAAPHRRLSAVVRAHDEVGVRPQADATSSGAPPTSAGSPATATSPTGRSRCGATEVVFEGVPTYPDAGRFWKMIQDHRSTSSTRRRRRSAR